MNKTMRIAHETGITLSEKDGTGTAIPATADKTEVVGVRRPSENTKEHPKKQTPRVNFDRIFLTVSFGALLSSLEKLETLVFVRVSDSKSSLSASSLAYSLLPGILTPSGPNFKVLAILEYMAICPPSLLFGPTLRTISAYLKMTMMVNSQKIQDAAPYTSLFVGLGLSLNMVESVYKGDVPMSP
ncbi:hypothetical protein OGAPHI_006430 [Ogataea philodendri]|uniref:Uncharacterized protein n=1 Tax=Ogataea philodendri TaxID=1378263 RepID=A0A9P8NY33_9ASCO|nr:uncharacterized protein OGAPHI_006430 [Ogataea philodendri]KAH3661582.1 hypothetical protein OGAPHI_006430 [Ogataea philodendri]